MDLDTQYKDCHLMKTWFVVLDYTFISIILLLLLALGTWSIIQSCSMRANNGLPAKFLILFLIPMITFLVTGLSISATKVLWIERCFFDVSSDSTALHQVLWFIDIVGYVLGLSGMFWSLSTRILACFEGSLYSVSSCTKKYIEFVSILQFAVCVVAAAAMAMFGLMAVSAVAAVIFLSYIVHSIIVTVTFRRKVKNLSETIDSVRRVSAASSTGPSSGQAQQLCRTRRLAGRLLVSVFFGLLSTGFVCINTLAGAVVMPDNHYKTNIDWTTTMIDLLINALCLTFQWSFGERLYFRMCTKCHRIATNAQTSTLMVESRTTDASL